MSEQTALMGLFWKSTAPASSILRSRNSWMTSGIAVPTGQPFWQRGFLQLRQRSASSTMCSAMVRCRLSELCMSLISQYTASGFLSLLI